MQQKIQEDGRCAARMSAIKTTSDSNSKVVAQSKSKRAKELVIELTRVEKQQQQEKNETGTTHTIARHDRTRLDLIRLPAEHQNCTYEGAS